MNSLIYRSFCALIALTLAVPGSVQAQDEATQVATQLHYQAQQILRDHGGESAWSFVTSSGRNVSLATLFKGEFNDVTVYGPRDEETGLRLGARVKKGTTSGKKLGLVMAIHEESNPDRIVARRHFVTDLNKTQEQNLLSFKETLQSLTREVENHLVSLTPSQKSESNFVAKLMNQLSEFLAPSAHAEQRGATILNVLVIVIFSVATLIMAFITFFAGFPASERGAQMGGVMAGLVALTAACILMIVLGVRDISSEK